MAATVWAPNLKHMKGPNVRQVSCITSSLSETFEYAEMSTDFLVMSLWAFCCVGKFLELPILPKTFLQMLEHSWQLFVHITLSSNCICSGFQQ